MIATPALRWFRYKTGRTYFDNNGCFTEETITTLQQKWVKMVYNDNYTVAHETDVYEWRDVPIEKE